MVDVEEFRAEVLEFLTSSLADGVACPAFGAIFPTDLHERAIAWQRHCFEHGHAGVDWPREHGGRGLGPEHAAIWAHECARADVAPYLNLQGLVLAGGAIRRFGSDEQKARFLRATLRGDIVWCQLFSEPGAGSDLASLSTTADAEGDAWRVTGTKVWSSNAQFADFAILLARTDPDAPRHHGISFFLLDMAASGVRARPLVQATGDAEFCEVFLDGVAIPADGLLGPLHGGWSVAMSVLTDERSDGGAGLIVFEREMQALRDLAEAPIAPHQRDRLASLVATGGALGQLLGRAGDDPRLAPLSKLGRTELTIESTGAALDIAGAAAMLDHERNDDALYARAMAIAGGTSEIQRNLIGERTLGLPREPRATDG